MNFRSTIAACVSLLLMSLTSCDSHDDGSNDLMFIRFDISGQVVDIAGMPVQGITVMAESAESVLTDANGMFTVHGEVAPCEVTAVRFVDADKTGKQYMSQTVMVDLVKYKEGLGWNNGYFRNSEELVVVMMEESVITPMPSDSGK